MIPVILLHFHMKFQSLQSVHGRYQYIAPLPTQILSSARFFKHRACF